MRRATMEDLFDRLSAPKSAASLVAHRVLFGTLMAASSVRFVVNGWVERCFEQPTFFFKYFGFGWVEVLPHGWMTGAFVVLAALAAMIAAGFLYRFATVAFFVLFTYVELVDVTNYLNHYYLVSLVALLFAALPANCAGSIDARLGLAPRSATVPYWAILAFRVQVGLVYVFAAVAKANSDWLVHAQPLQIWMSARTDTPVIGPWLDRFDVALFMSWAGFLHDLAAVPLLSFRRTRRLGFAMIVVFHAFTSLFFDIGIFPILMPISATTFFEPDWPIRLLERIGLSSKAPESSSAARGRAPSWTLALLALHLVVQMLVPLRAEAYGGNVLWHEQGMRFSWRVMLRKKSGSITYRVRTRSTPRELEVHPRRYLNDLQEREFSGQPDLVLQLAHRIARDFRARGHEGVEVRVDAWVSLNGRRAARMIDPDVDLARVDDGIAPARWILPAPPTSPPRIGR